MTSSAQTRAFYEALMVIGEWQRSCPCTCPACDLLRRFRTHRFGSRRVGTAVTTSSAQTSAHTPSAGAKRAARKLIEHTGWHFGTLEEIVEIVESETHAGELLAALEMCVKGLRDVKGNSVLHEWKEIAKTVIARAKGEAD